MKIIAATLAIISFTAFAYTSGAGSAEVAKDRQIDRVSAIELAVTAATK
jgi:hypothetical protein